jgi:type I restriction enzyme S subunit
MNVIDDRERGSAGQGQGGGMKEAWQIKTLGDVCVTVQDGAHESPKLQFDSPGNGRFLYITSKNIRNNYLDLENVTYVDEEFHNRIYPRCRPGVGDVLLTKDGANTGNVTLNTLDEPFSLLSSVCLIKTTPDFLLPSFLSYFIQSPDGLKSITGQMTGAAIKRIILRDIKLAKIPIPPLPEQQRIVALLDEAFAGLATAKANAERNLQNARAIFESHLQTVFSQRGVGWVEKTLEDVSITFGRGKSKHRPRNDPELYGGKYPFIQTGDIRNADHFITAYSQTYNEVGLSQSKLWPNGTICITIAANIAETAILGFDACFPDSVIGVVANPDEAETGFIEYLLQSFKARIQAMGKGSAQANINLATFEDQRFPFPSVIKQKELVEFLDHLAAETQRLTRLYERKLAALEELKKSLLHQAFNGEL